MSVVEILAVVGIIGYVIFRQVRGEALRGRRAVVLPAVLTVVGYEDLHGNGGGSFSHADLACLVVGGAGSVLIGLGFGWVTRLEERGGYLWAQLPVWGLWLWGGLVAWRLLMTGVAGAVHAHVAASSATLLFSLGLNRLAQAAVIVPRAMAMGVPFAPEKNGKVFLADGFARRPAAGPWQQQGSNTPQDAVPWPGRTGSRDPWESQDPQNSRGSQDPTLFPPRDRGPWDRS